MFLERKNACLSSCRLSRVCPFFDGLWVLILRLSIGLLFVASGMLLQPDSLCYLGERCRDVLLLLLLWHA